MRLRHSVQEVSIHRFDTASGLQQYVCKSKVMAFEIQQIEDSSKTLLEWLRHPPLHPASHRR